MIESLPWDESAGDPDKYIQILEEKKEEVQRDLRRLNRELRLVREVKKQKDIWDEWHRNGVPDQTRSRVGDSVHDNNPAEEGREPGSMSDGRTRKTRIIDLMRQNPGYIWKVADVQQALDDPKKECLRVAMDDLVREGKIMKHKGSNYEINLKHPEYS